jgi:hypothetical protein
MDSKTGAEDHGEQGDPQLWATSQPHGESAFRRAPGFPNLLRGLKKNGSLKKIIIS